jgi:hypothetical protein
MTAAATAFSVIARVRRKRMMVAVIVVMLSSQRGGVNTKGTFGIYRIDRGCDDWT